MVGTGLFYRVRRDFARGGCGGQAPGDGGVRQGQGRGAAPFGSAESHGLRPWSPPAAGGLRPALSPSASPASPASPQLPPPPPPQARQALQAPILLPLPLRKPDKPHKPGRGPAGPQAARRRRRASGLRSLRRLRRRACGPPCTLHRPLISTKPCRRAIMIYYPKGGALPCRITFIRRFTPPSAASRRGGSPPTARSPCWRAVRGLPASWAGRCTAIPPPASSPATVWCSGMAALHPALPSAGRGRSGRCWRPRASPFCRTAGWTCPAAGGKMRKKRCKGRIFL